LKIAGREMQENRVTGKKTHRETVGGVLEGEKNL